MVLSRKKIDHNIFRNIFGRGHSIGILLHVGAFKKKYATKLLRRTDIRTKINWNFWWNSVPHDDSNAYLPIFKIQEHPGK